jgi:hypothetical protein
MSHESFGLQCHAIPYNAIPYNAIPYNTMPYNAILYNTMPYNTMPCNTMPYNTMPCNTMPCNVDWNVMECKMILHVLKVFIFRMKQQIDSWVINDRNSRYGVMI